MAGEALYLDSSALVKLVLPEQETAALLEILDAWPIRAASELARVEVLRAARRAASDPAAGRRAEAVLAALHLIRLDDEILSRAATLEPWTLRPLDALHLASALTLGEDLGAMATYDSAMATAAATLGLAVVAPRVKSPRESNPP
jgi:predicted nucleic acid-binding protein